MKLRRFVSLSLMLSVVTMLATSIILYIVPQGRVAYWADWKLWGLTKTQWADLHTNLGLFMLIAAFFHLYFNWRPLTSYLKNKLREFRLFTREFNLALAVVVLFAALTLTGLPPLAWIQDLRANIEDSTARSLGEPPYGHAEESSLRAFFRNVNLDPDQAMKNLETAGIVLTDLETTLKELARDNGMAPRDLYEIMRGPAEQRPTSPLPIPESLPKGSGRLTLEAFCVQYNRDVDEAVSILQDAGLTVDAAATLRDNAATNGRDPLDLLDILREGFPR